MICYDCRNSLSTLDNEDNYRNRNLLKNLFKDLIKDIPMKNYKDFLLILDHIDLFFSFDDSPSIKYLLFKRSQFLVQGGTILLIFDTNVDRKFDFGCLKYINLLPPSDESKSQFVKINYNNIEIDDYSKFSNYKKLISHIKYKLKKSEINGNN